MSYQVLARKYRPQRFEDVVGQDHVTRTLGNAIKSGRIAHAYLFTGPRGTGKTTLARIFAKCLNATDGPRIDFEEDDPRTIEIAEGRSLDVLEIDGASNNGVEQVRELRETCRFAPASSKFKIYIIDEVHMLTAAAFNALLKTLEEPPAHVKFLFATTDPEKVLPTILSRCQRFDLRRIPIPLITGHLAAIAKKEAVQIDGEALHAIARGADGGMRDAESTLDQLISFCGDTIVEADVLSMFGLAAQGQLLALADAILAADGPAAIRELDQLATGGKDLGRLVSDLLHHFRNLLLHVITGGKTDQIEASEAELDAIARQSAGLDVDQTRRIMEVLADCEWQLRDAVSKKIVIEISLLKAIEARHALGIDTVLKQLNALRSGNEPAIPAPSPAAVRKPATAAADSGSKTGPALKETAPRPGGAREQPEVTGAAARSNLNPDPPAGKPVETGGLESIWSQLVDAAGRASPFVRTYLLEAHPVSFEGRVFTIGFDPEFSDHIGLVDNSKNHDLLATKMGELGHPGVRFKFIEAEAPAGRRRTTPGEASLDSMEGAPAADTAGSGGTRETPFDPNSFKDDPLIQRALEVFKGQIVNVRT
jgi:DNA polymerase-3 subunit gamma/tau